MTSSYKQHFNYFQNNTQGKSLGIKKELFKIILNKCKKNKSKTCRHKLDINSLKIYMDNEENLYFKEYCDILEFTQIIDGELDCCSCCYYFNRNDIYEWGRWNICKECLFEKQREERERKLKLEKQKISVFKISNWFLECKYNPKYKYCKDRINKMYEEEFN